MMFGGIKVRLANLRIQYRLSSAAVVASSSGVIIMKKEDYLNIL